VLLRQAFETTVGDAIRHSTHSVGQFAFIARAHHTLKDGLSVAVAFLQWRSRLASAPLRSRSKRERRMRQTVCPVFRVGLVVSVASVPLAVPHGRVSPFDPVR